VILKRWSDAVVKGRSCCGKEFPKLKSPVGSGFVASR
jgi:hypothetical protein